MRWSSLPARFKQLRPRNFFLFSRCDMALTVCSKLVRFSAWPMIRRIIRSGYYYGPGVRPSVVTGVHCASTTQRRKIVNGSFESLNLLVSKTVLIVWIGYVYDPYILRERDPPPQKACFSNVSARIASKRQFLRGKQRQLTTVTWYKLYNDTKHNLLCGVSAPKGQSKIEMFAFFFAIHCFQTLKVCYKFLTSANFL
jgi:hypothetical protein